MACSTWCDVSFTFPKWSLTPNRKVEDSIPQCPWVRGLYLLQPLPCSLAPCTWLHCCIVNDKLTAFIDHFSDQWLFKILPNLHPLMHKFTPRRRCQPCKETASSSGAVRVRCLTKGHLDTHTHSTAWATAVYKYLFSGVCSPAADGTYTGGSPARGPAVPDGGQDALHPGLAVAARVWDQVLHC